MNTLYDVLGVPVHANEKTIRTAFRKAAKSFHPDLNAGDPTAELQFRQLVAAYPDAAQPPAAQPEAETPLTREWDRVRATGDAMAIWEFAVRNPDAPEAQLARARLLTLIETSNNIFLLQVLRIGAPDAIAE